MRARLSAVAVAASLAAGTPASAAAPQIVDKADDANYVNLPAENPYNHNPTPLGSIEEADILSVEWRSLYDGRTLRGFTVTMILKAPPSTEGIVYRAIGASGACATLWLQFHSSKPALAPQASLRHDCDDGVTKVVEVPGRIQGRTVVWTVELGNRNVPRALRKGIEISGLEAHTRDYADNPECVEVAGCTTDATQYDVTGKSGKRYTIGS